MNDSKSSGAVWRKSKASASGECAEVLFDDGSVFMRHSHFPSGPVLAFTPSEWTAFLAGVRDGEFDLDENPPAVDG